MNFATSDGKILITYNCRQTWLLGYYLSFEVGAEKVCLSAREPIDFSSQLLQARLPPRHGIFRFFPGFSHFFYSSSFFSWYFWLTAKALAFTVLTL